VLEEEVVSGAEQTVEKEVVVFAGCARSTPLVQQFAIKRRNLARLELFEAVLAALRTGPIG
jgi:hypothetical protein